MELFMYDGTNTAYWVMFGSDTYAGGWKNVVLDCDLAPDSGTFDKTIVQRWGFRFNRTGAPANKDNTWVDYFRYGDGYYATGGTSGDEIELAGIYSQDLASGYGIIDIFEGIYYSYGGLIIGNGATTTWFKMDGDVLVFTDSKVATGLYSLSGVGTGCRVDIANSVLRSSGTGLNTRFAVDMSYADIVSCSIIDSLFTHAEDITFKSGQTGTGNTYQDCLQLIPQGADVRNSVISGYEGAVNTGAMYYNETADPDGEIDGSSFTKGTAATHAIHFGASAPTTFTLRDIDFSGYNASDANNDSTIRLSSSSDTTINLVNCTGNFSVQTDVGIAVTVVIDPVTLNVNVRDINSALAVQSARVLVVPADGLNYNYQESVTTITRSGSEATVEHTAHGLSNGDLVYIEGADQNEYNGVFSVTLPIAVPNPANNYYITVSGTPTTPATGTILSTEALISGTTDVNGDIDDTRSYSVDQNIIGRVRRATTGTLYKNSPITGTISAGAGLSLTVQMVPDE
jgi:hypothetical protein